MKVLNILLAGVVWVFLISACNSEGEGEYLERMAEEHREDSPVSNASSELSKQNQVKGQEVVYATVSGREVTGYLAEGGKAGEAPGMILIHEWWGLNDNMKQMAEKLAGEGYTALAVDLYDGKVASTPDSAKVFAGAVKEKRAIENLTQAYSYLTHQKGVQQIGTIGWCFGGGWSLKMALAYPDKVDATVIYYGRLVTDPRQLKELEMPVLGIFGAEDQGIPVKQVKEFEAALDKADVKNSIYIYDNAGHAFANPSGERYQKEAAEDAWQQTLSFLDRYLKEE